MPCIFCYFHRHYKKNKYYEEINFYNRSKRKTAVQSIYRFDFYHWRHIAPEFLGVCAEQNQTGR
jgi:hypothetical protein